MGSLNQQQRWHVFLKLSADLQSIWVCMWFPAHFVLFDRVCPLSKRRVWRCLANENHLKIMLESSKNTWNICFHWELFHPYSSRLFCATQGWFSRPRSRPVGPPVQREKLKRVSEEIQPLLDVFKPLVHKLSILFIIYLFLCGNSRSPWGRVIWSPL